MNPDIPMVDVLLRDLRYAFRTLNRDCGFALIAVLILGLGIGANIAVFSVVNTILLRPLPFPDAQQLARIVEKNPSSGESSKTFTADATQDFQLQNRSFQSVSGYFAFTPPDNFKLVGNGQPLPVTGLFVAEGFFQTLGVEPAMGRSFRPEEFVQHAQPVVLLSHPFWKRHFGGDCSIVGQTIHLNNASVTVIGVLPDTFDFGAIFSPGAKVDLFAPYMDDFRDDGNDLALFGWLRPPPGSRPARPPESIPQSRYAWNKAPMFNLCPKAALCLSYRTRNPCKEASLQAFGSKLQNSSQFRIIAEAT